MSGSHVATDKQALDLLVTTALFEFIVYLDSAAIISRSALAPGFFRMNAGTGG